MKFELRFLKKSGDEILEATTRLIVETLTETLTLRKISKNLIQQLRGFTDR